MASGSTPILGRQIKTFPTPNVSDVLFYEHHKLSEFQEKAYPVYGSAHPQPSVYPNHKLVLIEPADWQDGTDRLQKFWYCATFDTQHLYNYEVDNVTKTKWPQLIQTWFILRSAYTGPEMGVTTPPNLGQAWTRISDREERIGNERLDSIFVKLIVIYEDITRPLKRQQIDPESGRMVGVTITKVPADTIGQDTNTAGLFAEIEPLNDKWALRTEDKASGLIGAGRRVYQIHRPFPWPPVLQSITIFTKVGGGYGYHYRTKSWDGDCLIDVTETWSLTPPTLSDPISLGATSIVFRGGLIAISIPETLHPLVTIYEFSSAEGVNVTAQYPATNYTDWPDTLTITPSVRPHPKGGYVTTTWTVHKPPGFIG